MIRQQIITQNVTLVQENKFPHASLILGLTGYGILEVAISIARKLLCQNNSSLLPCENCLACKKSSKYIHPDLHFAFPVVKKDSKTRDRTTSDDFLPEWRERLAENLFFESKDWFEKIGGNKKSANINTAECNEIVQKLSLKAFEGERKILVIYLSEFLGKEGNKLLKLIEEPPANTYLILLAEDSKLILPTILSRCQVIKVGPLKDTLIQRYLNKNHQLEDSECNEIVFLSKGDLAKVIKLVNTPLESYSEYVLEWMRLSYQINNKPKLIYDWIDNLSKSPKIFIDNFINYMLHFFREYHLYLWTDRLQPRLKREEILTADKMKKIIDAEKVEQMMEIINTLQYYLIRNANFKLEMMHASIRVSLLLKK